MAVQEPGRQRSLDRIQDSRLFVATTDVLGHTDVDRLAVPSRDRWHKPTRTIDLDPDVVHVDRRQCVDQLPDLAADEIAPAVKLVEISRQPDGPMPVQIAKRVGENAAQRAIVRVHFAERHIPPGREAHDPSPAQHQHRHAVSHLDVRLDGIDRHAIRIEPCLADRASFEHVLAVPGVDRPGFLALE